MMNRKKMISNLKEGLCRVDFTKVNGEKREMVCTLNFDKIPNEAYPKDNDSVDRWPENLIKAYDIKVNGWRSFKVDSVLEFTPIPE